MKKTIIFLLAYLAFMFNANAQGAVAGNVRHSAIVSQENGAAATKENAGPKVSVSFKPYRPKRDCKRGLGICQITITITPGFVKALGTLTEGSLVLEFEEDIRQYMEPGEDLSAIQIDPDEIFDLPEEVVAAFGKNSITLLPGVYPVDYSASPFGVVALNITAN